MGTYTRFLYEFLAQFFAGLITILGGIGKGIGQLFNIPGYAQIIDHYKNDFSMAEWVLVVLAVIAVVVVVGMGFALIFFLIKKYLRFRAKVVKQEELLDEVAHLNNKVVNLMKEKDEILAMKVSQLGLNQSCVKVSFNYIDRHYRSVFGIVINRIIDSIVNIHIYNRSSFVDSECLTLNTFIYIT